MSSASGYGIARAPRAAPAPPPPGRVGPGPAPGGGGVGGGAEGRRGGGGVEHSLPRLRRAVACNRLGQAVATGRLLYAALDDARAGRMAVDRVVRGLYLPKGSNLSGYSQDELDAIADRLNTRPRKTLGWRSPLEVCSEHLARLTLQPDAIH